MMANDYYTNVSVTPSCSSSRWLTEEVFKLIDMVQHDEAIYNPRHKYYFCRPYVENFWREVDQKLEKNPGASLAKWTNLRISFRREYTNYLEEKVPPCWTYFDRMFFLHPYLRKKHSQGKSLDSQVQDALVRISSLSDRLQRERTAAVAANAAGSLGGHASNDDVHVSHLHSQQTNQPPIDNYLEYFDDPEQNNSDDMDDVIDEEQRSPFQHPQQNLHALNNDIKSECDDVKSDVDDYEPESAVRHDEEDNELEEMEMRSYMMDSYASSSTQNAMQDRRAQLRVQHLTRLQTRPYHDELRMKRPRSHDSITSTQMSSGSAAGSTGGSASATVVSSMNGHARTHCSTGNTGPVHTNVSLVRPTLAKPMDLVSTTTNNNGGVGIGIGVAVGNTLTNNSNSDVDLNASSSSTTSNQTASSSTLLHQHQRHVNTTSSHSISHHGGASHRLEIAAISSGSGAANVTAGATGTTVATVASLMNAPTTATASTSVPTTHMELCDCKTDPDAMFLMSLLPDIQKLNGRDRGKIKIAFQNILQDYLYPD